MRLKYALQKTSDFICAAQMYRGLRTHDQWSATRLKGFQQERLAALVRYSVAHSPFHRRRCGTLAASGAIELEQLPIMDKETMMEQFDEVVTDPRLKLRELREHLRNLMQDEYYLGEYRVLSTSGSTGVPAVFVYDRRAWSTVIACLLRWSNFSGFKSRFGRRIRISSILAGSPIHATRRLIESADFELTRTQRLSASEPVNRLVSALNEFQPDVLSAYPSIASLLAIEQLDGHLRISPKLVSTGSEMRTEEMERNIRQAWGQIPFNGYGLTEAVFVACGDVFHQGMHIFDDLVIVEVVDQNNRPVPNGTCGDKVLVTNLYNYAQPIIRYAVSDRITIATQPCPCGRPYQTISSIEGRSDDIIYLPGVDEREVAVHAIQFEEAIGACADVKEFQIVHEPVGIDLKVVIRGTRPREETADDLKQRLAATLATLGVVSPEVHVEFLERIERKGERMGKFKAIKSNVPRTASRRDQPVPVEGDANE